MLQRRTGSIMLTRAVSHSRKAHKTRTQIYINAHTWLRVWTTTNSTHTRTHTRKKSKYAERWHALREHCSRVMHW